MNPKIYQFLCHTLAYYRYIKSNCSAVKDIKSVSLILAGISCDDELKNFFAHYGITNESISNFYELRNIYMDSDKMVIDLLIDEFKDIVYGGLNKDKARGDITICSIIENRLRERSYDIDRLLDSIHVESDIFISLDRKVEAYVNAENKRKVDEFIVYLNKCGEDVLPFLENAVRVYMYLDAHRDSVKLVYDDNDREELSLLIASLLKDTLYSRLFEHNEMKLQNVIDKTNIGASAIEEIKNITPNMDLLTAHFLKYVERYKKGLEPKEEYTSANIIKAAFNDNINESQVIETIIARIGASYSDLKSEIMNGKEKEVILTKEQRLELFGKEIAPSIDTDSVSSIVIYGDNLSKHSGIISDELKELTMTDSLESSLSSISDLVNSIYMEKKEEPRGGLFSALFGSKEEPSVKREYNQNAVADLRSAIDENIEKLNRELVGYDYLKKYIITYLEQIDGYYAESLKEYEKIRGKLEALDRNDPNSYIEALEYTTLVQILADKVNRFKTSKVLMQHELVKVHQAIVNHFITINALKTSRDDLIPLIGSELMLCVGIESETNALDISSNILGLFHTILDKNVEGTEELLGKLKSTSLPSSTIDKITSDVSNYIGSVNALGLSNSNNIVLSLDGKKEDIVVDYEDKPKKHINLPNNLDSKD